MWILYRPQVAISGILGKTSQEGHSTRGMKNPKESNSILQVVLDVTAAIEAGRG